MGERDAATEGSEATGATRREGPTPARPRSELADERLTRGTLVGRYVVLDVLGQGGMGVVYTAYDPELNRRVALKLVQQQSGETEGAARMLREAQALARLSHPHVVAVYDVGTVAKRVFLAMELVDGITLSAWMRGEQRSWREVVAMFMAAGQGLAAAHAAGVIHRDFKPANVLVGNDGRVRVVDFGLARAATDLSADELGPSTPSHDMLGTELTQTGSVVGTPVYMPPEARRGELVGEAGDQFSFCVALFEALYGARPFDAKATELVVRVPPDSRVPVWLRKIVLRGLSIAPSERFESMTALLAALAADPAARRRRIALAGVALLGVSAVVAGGLAWRANMEAERRAADPCAHGGALAGIWDDSVRARLHAAFGATGVADADVAFGRFDSAIDDATARWRDARELACRDTRERHAQPETVLALRLDCLDTRKAELAELLELYRTVEPGQIEGAAHAIRRLTGPAVCADARSLSAAEQPPAAIASAVASVRQRLFRGLALMASGQRERARDLFVPLVAEAKALAYPPLVADTQTALCRDDNGLEDLSRMVATCTDAMVANLAAHKDAAAALAAAMRAQGRGFSGEPLAVNDERLVLARALVARAGSLPAEFSLEYALSLATGDVEQAIAHDRRAEQLAIEIFGEASDVTANSRNNLSFQLTQVGRYDESIAVQERAIATIEHAYGPDTNSLSYLVDNYGVNLTMTGRYAEARAALERVLAMRKGDDLVRATARCDLARVEAATDRVDEAIATGERGLAELKAQHLSTVELASNEDGLAAAYLAAKRYPDALALSHECLEAFHGESTKDSIAMVPCLVINGSALLELGRRDETRAVLDRAEQALQGHPAPPLWREPLARALARMH